MCGELEEEQAGAEEEIYLRFSAHVHSFLYALKTQGKTDNEINRHLDRLFRSALTAILDDDKAPDGMSHYQRMAMEPLVLARAAGFVAAHLPLAEDPLRRLMEAMMLGYSEGEIEFAHGGPDHDHGHGFHGHSH